MEKEFCEDCGNSLPSYRRADPVFFSDGAAKFLCDPCWGARLKFHEAHGYPMPDPKVDLSSARELADRAIANRTKYLQLLNRQFDFLLAKGYHAVRSRWTIDQFATFFMKPLAQGLFVSENLPDFDEVEGRGEIPLVVVFPDIFLRLEAQLALIGAEPMPAHMERFLFATPLSQQPYLALGVSKKKGTEELPLVIEEGVAVAAYFRETMKEWKCITMPGSCMEGTTTTPYLTVLFDDSFAISAFNPEVLDIVEMRGFFSCSRRIFA
jgi:hypothetical protein